jgi:hypothetical protein
MSSRATATAAPMATPKSAPPKAAPPMPAVPRERIAMRAYEKWLKRGCKDGHAEQDWIEAEKELLAELAKAPGRR